MTTASDKQVIDAAVGAIRRSGFSRDQTANPGITTKDQSAPIERHRLMMRADWAKAAPTLVSRCAD